jgi:hypothetical protein
MESRICLILAVCTVWLMVAADAAAQPALAVAVSDHNVTVSNVTPGGSVVLFSCEQGAFRGKTQVRPRAAIFGDTDRDGQVRFEPASGTIDLRSVWVAIDYESGAIAFGAPAAFAMTVIPLSAETLRKDAENEIATLLQDATHLHVVVVRPGKGAWWMRGRDGTASDRDATPGRLALNFDETTSLDGKKEKGPKHLKKGDIVAAINPGHLEVFFTEIGK